MLAIHSANVFFFFMKTFQNSIETAQLESVIHQREREDPDAKVKTLSSANRAS